MKKFLPLFFTVFCCMQLCAQTDTLFWFAAPEISTHTSNFDRPIVMRITTYNQSATVTISQPAGTMPAQTVIVPAANTQTVDLTTWIDIIENKPANTTLGYGLKVQSTAPVSIYYEVVSSQCQCNPEIFVLKGQNAMGTDFYIPSQSYLDNNAGYTPQPFSSFDVVATQNNTTVNITPSNALVGHAAGVPFSITLNAGETFSNTALSNLAAQHLMGSRVTADKPIAITVKDDLLSGTPFGGCADLGGDQIVPTSILGTEYIAMNGFLNAPGDQLFITATQNGTTISKDGAVVTTINAGQTIQVAVGGTATYIQTSQPAYVWQMSGIGCEIGLDVLPPIVCTGSLSVSITRSTTEDMYVNLAVRTGGQGNFLVNGATGVITSAQFSAVPGTGGQWMAAQVSLPNAQYPQNTAITITNSSSLFHLGVVHGGPGSGTRFGYFSNFAKVLVKATAGSADVCVGSTIQLMADTLPLAVYSWTGPNNFTSGQQNPTIPNAGIPDSGNYIVTASVFGCTSQPDTTPVAVRPNYSYSVNAAICAGALYTLPDGSTVSTAGTYPVHLTTAFGCDSDITTSLTVTTPNIQANNDTAVCKGQTVQMNATGGLIYSWSPATGLNNPNVANPLATPAATTTYRVTSQVPSANLITNGDFSGGNTGFSSSYAYTTPPNTSEGQYWVSTSAQAWNGGMSPCGDHTSGNGNMLIVNGATSTNVSIYCQTVNVMPNTDYAFSTWLQTVSAGNPAQLQFSVNGTNLGQVFTANTNTCIWEQFYTTWNSGSNTSATICIVNQNTQAGANDFTLDDISFAQLCTGVDSVTITVYPTDTTVLNPVICQGDPYTLPDGTQATATGTYTHILTSAQGCDSLVITNLTVHPSYAFTIDQTICPSDVYTLPDGSSVNISGTYIDTLTTVNGCDSIITVHLTVVSPAILVSNDTAVCQGAPVQLTASGGLFTYSWQPATGLSDANIANPVATPAQTTTYVVTTQVASGDLIANGDFSGGNAGFSSGYTYSSNLVPEGVYYVGPNPNNYHSGFSACPDHTTGTGNMMVVNGSGTAGTNVWCETINVVPNTDYAFSCWGESVASGSPAVLQFSISGNLLGSPFTVPLATCQWQQFYATWNSGVNTTANICIVNQNTATGGNDFALDDISFVGLCTATDSVTVTVNNPVTVVVDTAICQGTTYTFPAGNTATVATTDTAVLTNQSGCDSTVITHLVVNPSPVVDVYDTICQGTNYVRPSGTIATATGVYNDTLATVTNCDSVIITHLTVHPASAVVVTDTICSGSSYTLPDGSTATGSGSYPVTLTNQYGCDSTITTVLTVIKDTLSAAVTQVLCNGGTTGAINAVAANGLSPYTFNLLSGASQLASNTTGNFAALAAGTYTINVTDNFGCTAATTATVTEPAALVISDSTANATCYSQNDGYAIIDANGGTPGYTFNLSGNTNNSGTFNQLSAGTYTYTVTDANGCTGTASLTITQPQQILITLTPPVVDVKLGENAQLLATTNYDPGANYVWTPATGLSCYTCPNPEVAVYNSTTYQLQVSVNTGNATCYATTQVDVTVTPDYGLFVPNAFTPNGDGSNDLFSIFGNMPAVKFVEAEIFNRIGEKVFFSNDINFSWDGTYKGLPAPPGVYVYQVKIVFVDNHAEKLLKGTLTLLR